MIPEAQILHQLLKNRYYLKHLGRQLHLYTVITDSMTCCRLEADGTLAKADFSEIPALLKTTAGKDEVDIDAMFQASAYLVSPFNTPEKFIHGEYFLTQAQEQIKREVVRQAQDPTGTSIFHITGKPGTGKTLLLYDIARALAASGKTLILHNGKLTRGQHVINSAMENMQIRSADGIGENDLNAGECRFLLVDEAHRLTPEQFQTICRKSAGNPMVCIFSSDPEQVLTSAQKRNNITACIRKLPLEGEYVLAEKIRMNEEMNSFITRLKNLNSRTALRRDYTNVSVNCAASVTEAGKLIEYYRNLGYTFINYSRSNGKKDPYREFDEDFDTHHVIGQEFDKVVMLMDWSFYYDRKGRLKGCPHPDPDYLYPNLFYQGITRVREKLALVIVRNQRLFEKIISIL
jgi:molybdopterin-guanine dinucleotide biosynthesis protein